MSNDDLSKISYVEIAINVLNEALQKLQEHEYASAQVMVSVARQVLEDLQLDFDQHSQIEEKLKNLLNQSLK